MDSLPPNKEKNYTTDTKTSCIINPNYKETIPPGLNELCTGSYADPWGPTGANGMEAFVGSSETPPMFYVNGLILTFGACTTTIQGENLSYLANTIYSCNQSTGVFTVHK